MATIFSAIHISNSSDSFAENILAIWRICSLLGINFPFSSLLYVAGVNI